MRARISCSGCGRAVIVASAAFFYRPSSAGRIMPDTIGFANSQILNDPFPYYFPQENGSATRLFAMPLCYGVKIEEATIEELQTYLADGSLTSVQLVTCYTQRSFQTAEYIKSVLPPKL